MTGSTVNGGKTQAAVGSQLPTHPSSQPLASEPPDPVLLVFFQPGDRVVVPPYGIGVVCETCLRQVSGQGVSYYAIEFAHSSSRAFVPVHGQGNSGMRAALTSRETPRLLRHLQEGCLILPSQWSARQRQVTEILVSGDPFELATLTCELRRWNNRRSLPDLDRQAFRQAIRLLEQEMQGLEDLQAAQVRELLGHAWSEGPNGGPQSLAAQSLAAPSLATPSLATPSLATRSLAAQSLAGNAGKS